MREKQPCRHLGGEGVRAGGPAAGADSLDGAHREDHGKAAGSHWKRFAGRICDPVGDRSSLLLKEYTL